MRSCPDTDIDPILFLGNVNNVAFSRFGFDIK